MSIAAVLVLRAGVIIGRATAPRPVNVEQLHADLQASILASLRPAVQESILAKWTNAWSPAWRSARRACATNWRSNCGATYSFRHPVHRRLGTTDGKRFTEFVQLIEEARLKDRLLRGQGLGADRAEPLPRQDPDPNRSLAALIEKKPAAIQH
jgi:hypothetical protein